MRREPLGRHVRVFEVLYTLFTSEGEILSQGFKQRRRQAARLVCRRAFKGISQKAAPVQHQSCPWTACRLL